MGNSQGSYPKLSADVSLNRIRDACQWDPSVPEVLKTSKIELLANDLNAMGMDIPIVGPNGHRMSNDQICSRIREQTLPDVEAVCMMHNIKNSKGGRQALVEKMVAHFNTYYGARISVYKNPLHPEMGKRSVPQLCDDMYMVVSSMKRKLDDKPQVVKAQLEKEFHRLQQMKNKLNNNFYHLVGDASANASLDERTKQLKALRDIQRAMNNKINSNLAVAKQSTIELIKEIVKNNEDKDNLLKLEGNSPGFLSGLLSSSGLSGMNEEAQLKSILSALNTMPVAYNNCNKCLANFGMTLDEYEQASKDDSLNDKLRDKLTNLSKRLSGPGSQAKLAEILKCYDSLMNNVSMCKNSYPDKSADRTFLNVAMSDPSDARKAANLVNALISENSGITSTSV